MNLSASLGETPGNLSASLGAGQIIMNGYVLSLERAEGGYVFTVSRGSDVQTAFIPDGAAGRGIVSARLNADYTLTLTFSDLTAYTTPPIRGERGSSDWADITNKPAAFPALTHSHTMEDIAGLNALEALLRSGSEEASAYHLGFYIDGDGDVCQA